MGQVDPEDLRFEVRATFRLAQQTNMGGGGQRLVLVAITVPRLSVSDFTTRTVERLKLFLASVTGVPLDAIRVMDVQRWMTSSDASVVEAEQGDLRVCSTGVEFNGSGIGICRPYVVPVQLFTTWRSIDVKAEESHLWSFIFLF